MTTIIVKNRH